MDTIRQWLSDIFSMDFMPHGHCILWKKDLLTMHVASDVLIALSYYSIPLAILYFIRRRKDVIYPWVPRMFAAFILACGTTHIFNIITIWQPYYWLEGYVKLVTALISIATAVMLWPLMPSLLKIPNPMEVEKVNRSLNVLNAELERRVGERTADLLAQAEQLQQEVSIRMESERRMKAAFAEVSRSNQELEQFAYAASHDLREPLRKIQLFGGLILNEEKHISAESRDYLERVESAAGRMDGLIQALLQWSRVNTKGLPFNTVNLNQTLRQALDDLSARVRKTGAQVSLPTQTIQLEADAAQIHRLFLNLLGNSLKFQQKGVIPVITVSSRLLDENNPLKEPAVEITVTDNGVGFDPGLNEEIFQIFFRGHARSAYEGTGIGLALCQKIVQRHRGTISAAGKPGEGAVFTVLLPQHQPEIHGPHPPA